MEEVFLCFNLELGEYHAVTPFLWKVQLTEEELS